MALMIPENGPVNTGSKRAEPDIYWRLSKQLPDDFIVIHSIPWLSSVAYEIDNRYVPTGEIDFLILHPVLGILAIEVKGGVFGFDRTMFVYLRTGKAIDPIRQIRRGTHGLSKWIAEQRNYGIKIGYALLFPDSEMKDKPLPPALKDNTQTIVIDKSDLSNIGEKIQEIMRYWKTALAIKPLGDKGITELTELICPKANYTPSWNTQIDYDTKTWLRLTPEQTKCLEHIYGKKRAVVTGWPGTGKTLIAISLARKLARTNLRVLFLVYNVLLMDFLKSELSNDSLVKVINFHGLCREASELTGTSVYENSESIKRNSQEWYQIQAPKILNDAVEKDNMPKYDVLIVDEAQVFDLGWWETITKWMNEKIIVAFCDETQVFSFEKKINVKTICEVINSGNSFILTVNLRSPASVFNRLQQVKQSDYQQYCPRPYEPETLTELAPIDPEKELYKIVQKLIVVEKISKEAIKILYTSTFRQPPRISIGYAGNTIDTFYVSKFRGLESPVIIVWAVGSTDDISLFCAYSRATTRCIIIYCPLSVSKQECGTFGQLLLNSELASTIIKNAHEVEKRMIEFQNERLTSNIIKNMELNLTPVVTKTANISWCHNWGAWIFPITNIKDEISRCWLYHLSISAQESIYYWYEDTREFVYYIKGRLTIFDDIQNSILQLLYCNKCKKITLNKIVEFEKKCLGCENEFIRDIVLPNEAKNLIKFDETLNNPQNPKYAEIKKRMSIPLIAMGRWKKLSVDERNTLSPVSGCGRIGYESALILTGIDIINTKPNEIISLDNLAKKYFKWCPILEAQITFSEWRKMVANALATWKHRNFLNKKEKGMYYRLPQNEKLIKK